MGNDVKTVRSATKADIISAMASELAMPTADVTKIFDTLLLSVTELLKTRGRIELRNFGSWTIKERAARTGRNPATGEALPIPASKTVYFRPSPVLKKTVTGA